MVKITSINKYSQWFDPINNHVICVETQDREASAQGRIQRGKLRHCPPPKKIIGNIPPPNPISKYGSVHHDA